MIYPLVFKANSIFAGLHAAWSISALLNVASASLLTLKTGGVVVHTTGFNLSSETDSFESRDLSIYRKCDIESVVVRLEKAGHYIEPLDFSRGATFVDGYVDLPPYRSEPHLRLRIGECDCTSSTSFDNGPSRISFTYSGKSTRLARFLNGTASGPTSTATTSPLSVTGTGTLDTPARRTNSPVFSCSSLIEIETLPFFAMCHM